MLRRKLGLRMDDQKELRVKPVPTWCTKHSHMASAKARRTRIATRQSKLLPSRRRRIKRRMRVGSCAVPQIIGQKNAQTTKEENLNLSRRLRTWWLVLDMELVGMVIYHLFFQCFNLPLGGLSLVQIFMCVLMFLYFLLTGSPEIHP
jgi:hypothetical protein